MKVLKQNRDGNPEDPIDDKRDGNLDKLQDPTDDPFLLTQWLHYPADLMTTALVH